MERYILIGIKQFGKTIITASKGIRTEVNYFTYNI